MRAVILALLSSLLLLACGGADEAPATDTAIAPSAAEPADEAGDDAGDEDDAEVGDSAAAAAGEAAEDPAATAAPKDDAALELPAVAPTPTGPPTEGLPGGRYVEITDISAEGSGYAVTFTPYNFVPLIGPAPEDHHVHFFFDTVAPENAGTNGPSPGTWFLYDGPSPFTGYTFVDRPPAATRMCALVADAAHGVTVGSGNCVTLP